MTTSLTTLACGTLGGNGVLPKRGYRCVSGAASGRSEGVFFIRGGLVDKRDYRSGRAGEGAMIKRILMRPLACSGAASVRCRKSLGRACSLSGPVLALLGVARQVLASRCGRRVLHVLGSVIRDEPSRAGARLRRAWKRLALRSWDTCADYQWP